MPDPSWLRRGARPSTSSFDTRSLDHGEDHGLHDQLGNSGVQRLAQAGAQAKLEVGGADDAYEREADEVADEVMGGHVAQPARTTDAPAVQRSGGGEAFAADADVSDRIDHAGGGQSLPDDVRSTMEAKTGASFADVRVHDDAAAHQVTADVGAHAFTHGRDIHFARGAYDPSSRAGQHLLAHELTHVVQQRGGQGAGVQRKAISAAPASVQRFWDPREWFRSEEKETTKVPDMKTIMSTPELRSHWSEWNHENGWDDGDIGMAYMGWYLEFQEYCQLALMYARKGAAEVPDAGIVLKGDDPHLKQDLLAPLRGTYHAQIAEVYEHFWDKAWKLVERLAKDILGKGDTNLSREQTEKFKQRFEARELFSDGLFPVALTNTESHDGAQYRGVHKSYSQDKDVQDFYKKRE